MQCYLKGGNRVLVANNGSTAGYCTKGPTESANISALEAGGFADIAAHEAFCAAGDCVILGSSFCTKNMISEGTSRASLPYLAAHTA